MAPYSSEIVFCVLSLLFSSTFFISFNTELSFCSFFQRDRFHRLYHSTCSLSFISLCTFSQTLIDCLLFFIHVGLCFYFLSFGAPPFAVFKFDSYSFLFFTHRSNNLSISFSLQKFSWTPLLILPWFSNASPAIAVMYSLYYLFLSTVFYWETHIAHYQRVF